MKSVIQEAIRLMEARQPFVVATVVHTRGSTPQKLGAKLLVRADGSGVGTLGGGCVEGDIWFAARECLRQQGEPEYRDYLLNEDIAARDGLVCGGSMYFFIEPVRDPSTFLPMAREIALAYEGGPLVSLATVVRTVSSVTAPGGKLFVRQDGSTVGTLGDPELDRQIAEAAQGVMPLGQTRHMVTGAGDEIYLEGFTAPATLVLMGGGHVNRAIATIGKQLGFRLFVMDDRPEFANTERFPDADQVAVTSYDEGLEPFLITRNTAVVVASRGHRYDDMALETAALSPAWYVGLIGSKRKVILIYERLLRRGISLERVRELHAPIGLDIGGRTPEEIAVSVVAEILQSRYNTAGQPMKLEAKRLEKLHAKVLREQQAQVLGHAPAS